MILCTGCFFFTLPLHVPAAESIPEGMQSGQLLQAGAPAAGEGTGEQQPHHRTETEGLFRSGRCHRCGECVRVCVWEKDKRIEVWGPKRLVPILQIAIPVSSFYPFHILVFCVSLALLPPNITFLWPLNLQNAGRCSEVSLRWCKRIII